MKDSTRGVLLSGLVYPGVGQIVQKHYWRGIALISVVTVTLFLVVRTASAEVEALLASIEAGGGEYDVTAILTEATRFAASRVSDTIRRSSILIFCCWAIGVADAYLSGKRLDADRSRRQEPQPLGTPPTGDP
jgi:hypothetical protein